MQRFFRIAGVLISLLIFIAIAKSQTESQIGREVAVPVHLQDGQEFQVGLDALIRYGRKLFTANFTVEDGAGRPLTKGTGAPLTDPSSPLVFPRAVNRVSGPDSNSCAGCHNEPFAGGMGDRVGNVFVLGQRFDFATFDENDRTPTRGTVDERGVPTTLQTISDERATPDMFGSGYTEMLARQITADLQAIRDRLKPGQQAVLISKGIFFGVLARNGDGSWNTSRVQGLPPQSLKTSDAETPPSLIICPFSQAGVFISLRQFTVTAFNQHHGMQATERFGIDTDPDGDGVVNELTRADITACTIFQATLPVPVRSIPRDPVIRRAAEEGERLFRQIGCASCHIPALPLDKRGWIYSEPNPYNPAGTLQPGQAPALSVDLADESLPQPRLVPHDGVVMVPIYTDFKVHDITSGPNDPNREPLDQNAAPDSPAFFAGNGTFMTRRLWAVGSKPNFFHHGQFTTIREAIVNHSGEALATRQAFSALSRYEQGAIIEFLKTLKAPDEFRLPDRDHDH